MSFYPYLKAVGTGPKGNRELSKEEMTDAMQMILQRQIPDELISAFLLGWRVRSESTVEFQACLEVFQSYIKKSQIKNSLELGYTYDGKTNHPYLLPLIARYLKSIDLKLVVSIDDLQPAKKGHILKDILSYIKKEDNIVVFDRKDYFKELHSLTNLRNILGLRTAFNTLEKLLNPANSSYAITGVFHKPYVQKYYDLFQEHYESLVIVKGNEGTPEIFTQTKFFMKENEQLKEYSINPADFGINYEKSKEKISLEKSLELIDNPSEEILKLAKLNAAFFAFISKKISSIEEAYNNFEI